MFVNMYLRDDAREDPLDDTATPPQRREGGLFLSARGGRGRGRGGIRGRGGLRVGKEKTTHVGGLVPRAGDQGLMSPLLLVWRLETPHLGRSLSFGVSQPTYGGLDDDLRSRSSPTLRDAGKTGLRRDPRGVKAARHPWGGRTLSLDCRPRYAGIASADGKAASPRFQSTRQAVCCPCRL